MLKQADRVDTNVTLERLPNEAFRTIFSFWLDAKGDRELPPQEAINPSRLPRKLLPQVGMISVEDGPKRYKVRLVGTAVAAAVGMNGTGQYTEDIPRSEAVNQRHDMLVETRRPYYVEGPLVWSPNDFRTHRTLALPFAGPDGRVSRIFTYAEFE